MAVLRCRDAEGTGILDRLPEQIDQRIADALIGDTAGRKKKLQRSSRGSFDAGDDVLGRFGVCTP
jgi:hypothetical protein